LIRFSRPVAATSLTRARDVMQTRTPAASKPVRPSPSICTLVHGRERLASGQTIAFALQPHPMWATALATIRQFDGAGASLRFAMRGAAAS